MAGTAPALDEAPGIEPQVRAKLTQMLKDPETSDPDKLAIRKALQTGVIPAPLLRRLAPAEEGGGKSKKDMKESSEDGPEVTEEETEESTETVATEEAEQPAEESSGTEETASAETEESAPEETEEAASAAPSNMELVESTSPDVTGTTEVSEADTAESPAKRRRRIKLISAGWSKNGRYYPDSTLREAARANVFPAGTPMYVDHPTKTQKEEQPERSIRDLAARLDTDAVYADGALYAEATHFGMWHPVLNGPNGLADHIDLSVRCFGDVRQGVAEGREGVIVERITEGKSVDFVTEGAAGGKILELIESAGAGETGLRELMESVAELEEGGSVGAHLEAQLHMAFTQMADEMYGCGKLTREERIALSNSIGDALSSFVTRIERDQPQLYKRDRWSSPPEMSESTSDGVPVEEGTEMQENTAPAPGTTRALVEKELAEARAERDLAIAQSRAREMIPHLIAEAWVSPTTQLRITSTAMAQLPISGGKLDEVGLTKIVGRLVEEAERETAETLEAAGIGSPRALGDRMSAGEGFGPNTDELKSRLSEAFTSMGLSEAAAKTAVRGREV